jgi:hypothetical protein
MREVSSVKASTDKINSLIIIPSIRQSSYLITKVVQGEQKCKILPNEIIH